MPDHGGKIGAPLIRALARHQPALAAFCRANLVHREDAQEALPNTHRRLLEKAADWNPETPFLPFTIRSRVRDQGL